jgi:hypothetical protein
MGVATVSFYTRLFDFMAGAIVRSQDFDDELNAIQGGFASVEAKAIQVPDSNTLTLPNAAGRANKLLFFDASGNATATNNVPDPVADMDVANRRWVQTLALTGTISVGPGDAGKIMSNDGSGIQWTAKDNLFPSMAGNAGRYLTTDGSTRTWQRPVIATLYDNRGGMRTMTGSDLLAWVAVEGLGLFQHFVGSTDGPDDDETAFATASGLWLLVCPSWDVVDAFTLSAEDYQDGRLASAESFTAKMFRATSTQSAFTLAVNSSTTFAVTVTGAVVGASVVATAPSAPTLNSITMAARVSAANTVTVYIGNASSTNSGGFGAGDWQITVINK